MLPNIRIPKSTEDAPSVAKACIWIKQVLCSQQFLNVDVLKDLVGFINIQLPASFYKKVKAKKAAS